MKALSKINKTLDSREVAEMVDRQHKELLRDIRTYREYLGKSNIARSDFFIESTYSSEQNKVLPCFLCTRKGCEMIANKMTGQKGVAFTAKYINRFHEMEQGSLANLESLSPQLQLLIGMEMKQKQFENRLDEQDDKLNSFKDVVALNPTKWRKETGSMINKMAQNMGGSEHIGLLRSEIYDLLDDRFGVSLSTRLTNKRRRMAEEGVCKSKRDKLNPLDVIGDDKKLIEGYVSIVKEMAIKYGC